MSPLESQAVVAFPLPKTVAGQVSYTRDLLRLGAQGTRYNEFRFREDGSVSVWTRIESEHLPKRVSYDLEYHRAP